ncbi:MAG TPA: hypothetical protein VG297_04190 [Bryobacteraceae bacterium]|jgi:anti-sigma factor RsiW|nr:hypothetical protein [Bryobacteraceae bacterium]
MNNPQHPSESDLALLAGGEASRVRRLLLDRHVRGCEACQETVAAYRDLRDDVAEGDLPGVNWNFLAPEMRANIQVGLEAGACVGTSPAASRWAVTHSWASAGPRLAVAFATLVLLVVSGFYVRDIRTRPATVPADATPVLESTSTGVGIRIADKSFMLPSHSDTASNQTVSARGDVEARVVDDKGSVTINNVYLQ